MKSSSHVVSFGLAVVFAAVGAPAAALAGCTPGVMSSGAGNTCVGSLALEAVDGGSENTAVGAFALNKNTAGSSNTAVGVTALIGNITGGDNAAMGSNALSTNNSGSFNSAFGSGSLINNASGSSNTAIGYHAGGWAAGSSNIALGADAGSKQIQGSYNIAIGAPGAFDDKFTIRIGRKDKQTSAFIAGIRGVNITGGQAVVVSASGQLGTAVSSRRYKQDIHEMGDASAPLMKLRPVTFRYKQADENGARPLQYGLIAEDVARTMPGLAIYGEDGAPISVAYQALPPLLLNEYQKQQRQLLASQAELGSLKEKLAASEERLAVVEARLAALDAKLGALAASGAEPVRTVSAP